MCEEVKQSFTANVYSNQIGQFHKKALDADLYISDELDYLGQIRVIIKESGFEVEKVKK